MNPPEIKRASYLNLEVSEKGLSEFSGGKRIIFIPKEEVRTIEVRFGSSAERPMLQVIAGLLLIGLGLVGAAMIAASGMRGFRWGVGFLIFGCFGVWFLYETVKKSHFLRVVCHNDARKLVFRGNFSEADFATFSKEAADLGYSLNKHA